MTNGVCESKWSDRWWQRWRRALLALCCGIVLALGLSWIATAPAQTPSPDTNSNSVTLDLPQPSQFSQAEPTQAETEPRGKPTPLLVNGLPVFNLQSSAQFPSDLRVLNVTRRIDKFLSFRSNGTIPLPDVRALQDTNNQYVLYLGEVGQFNDTRIPLFTVTYEDAAAELGEAPAGRRLLHVRQVAEAWDDRLEQALVQARQDKIDLRRARRPLYLALSVVASLTAIAAIYPLWRLLNRGLQRIQILLGERTGENWSGWLELGIFCLHWLLRVAIVGVCLHLALYAIPLLRHVQRELYFRIGQSTQAFLGLLQQPIIPNTAFSISSLVLFGILAAIAYIIARNLSLLVRERFLRRSNLDIGTQETTATAIQYLLTLIGIIIVLPSAGIDFSSIALVAGAVGLGIGFGLQNLSNNFISGLVVLFERPIQVGDFIEIEDLQGTVERISIRATAIRTQDNIYVIVPNSRFVEANVVNWSYRSPRCRIHITVGVAYASDTDAVKEAMLAAARSNPRVLTNPEPRVWLNGFGDSALNFDLLVWTSRPQARFDLESELNLAILAEFKQHGIEIPFPQRDLHLRSVEDLRDMLAASAANGRPSGLLEQPALPGDRVGEPEKET
ncbi:MAG: mechanosensitive ion channel domain-containing protein [Cyanobacteria bacterium P01_F01_bin.33]